MSTESATIFRNDIVSKQYLSNMLMETTITIANLEYELDSSQDPEVIKSLSYDLGIVQTIHDTLKTHVKRSIEDLLNDISPDRLAIGNFEIEEDIFTLYTYNDELTEKELKVIARLLGCKYYSSSMADIGYSNWWTNNEMEV